MSYLFFKGSLRNFLHRVLSAILSNLIPFFLQRFILNMFGSEVEKGVCIHGGVTFYYGLNNLTIGKNSTINRNTRIDNRGPIDIGSNVSISQNCWLLTGGHNIQSSDFEYQSRKIIIKDYAVIFSSAIICPGVTVGKGSVILPGSIVTKNIPDYEVWGGNPATFLKKRINNLNYVLNHSTWFSL